MRLVVAGTPDVALASLDALLASRHEVVAVLTRPDAAAGRGRRQVASPVAQRAREVGLPVLQPVRPRGEEFLDELRSYAPDACPVVAYGALVPAEALAVPRLGWLNLHFSLLPAWRGAAPVQRALMHGDDVTGACVFQLEEGLDTGPVYASLTEPVGAHDTAGDLLGRLALSGAQLLVDVLDALEDGAAVARPQEGEATPAPKIGVEEARVDWRASAVEVDRRVRGCTPDPGAWTTFRGERVKLGPVVPVDGPDLAEGAVLVERKRVLVGTGPGAGGGAVALGTVQAAGKKAMSATDWARGTRPGPGEEFA